MHCAKTATGHVITLQTMTEVYTKRIFRNYKGKFCILNARLRLNAVHSWWLPATDLCIHACIYKYGEKQTCILSTKHMMSVCAGKMQFRETVIVQCSVSLCVFGCSYSCFWNGRVCKESWGQDSRPIARKKRGKGRKKKRVDPQEDMQGVVGRRSVTAAYKKIVWKGQYKIQPVWL